MAHGSMVMMSNESCLREGRKAMRYILIDEYSGYVWGEAVADDPISACREIDADAGLEPDRHYIDIGSERFDGRSGYHVHLAPDDFVGGDDGRDQEYINAVERLPLVARILTFQDRLKGY
jgi:hypothetical protein